MKMFYLSIVVTVTRLLTFVTIHVVTLKTVNFKEGNLLSPISKLQSEEVSADNMWMRLSGRSVVPSPTLCDRRAHAHVSRVMGPLGVRTKREKVRKRRSPAAAPSQPTGVGRSVCAQGGEPTNLGPGQAPSPLGFCFFLCEMNVGWQRVKWVLLRFASLFTEKTSQKARGLPWSLDFRLKGLEWAHPNSL